MFLPVTKELAETETTDMTSATTTTKVNIILIENNRRITSRNLFSFLTGKCLFPKNVALPPDIDDRRDSESSVEGPGLDLSTGVFGRVEIGGNGICESSSSICTVSIGPRPFLIDGVGSPTLFSCMSECKKCLLSLMTAGLTLVL
jgi:hypothetical protein